MQVVIVEPKKKPMVQNIDDGLEAMQEIVGGTIQATYPFEEPIVLICNDEGKILNLPLNRALRDSSGRVYDIVAGSLNQKILFLKLIHLFCCCGEEYICI